MQSWRRAETNTRSRVHVRGDVRSGQDMRHIGGAVLALLGGVCRGGAFIGGADPLQICAGDILTHLLLQGGIHGLRVLDGGRILPFDFALRHRDISFMLPEKTGPFPAEISEDFFL